MIEPKLRFKADDGSQFPDWEENVFGDFVDTHLEKTSDKDKYPLYSLTIESGVQPKTDRYEREFLVKKEGDNYKIVPPNGFVYNPMNLRFGALKVNHEKFSVSVSGYYDVFSLKDDNVLAFWENYLVTPKMLNYYFSIATGSLIEKLRVHYSQFVKIKKPLPSLPEQQKIAKFLSIIDTVIEKQKETVSAWEERKKGVMQKLFSQEVRFKADDGSEFPDWEEKKIDDVATCFAGATPSTKIPEYWEEGTIRWMSSGEVNNGQIHDTEKRISQLGFDKCSTKMVKPNSVVMALAGQGKTRGMVAITRVPLCTNQSLCAIETNDEICDDYLYQYLQTQYNNLRLISSGDGTRGGLNLKLVGGYVVVVPYLEEQQKIANCLSSLDEVIEKQKEKLAAWEELKKGLLQQMFV